jgi:hypothetical protein
MPASEPNKWPYTREEEVAAGFGAGRAAMRVYGLPSGFGAQLIVVLSDAGHNKLTGTTRSGRWRIMMMKMICSMI